MSDRLALTLIVFLPSFPSLPRGLPVNWLTPFTPLRLPLLSTWCTLDACVLLRVYLSTRLPFLCARLEASAGLNVDRPVRMALHGLSLPNVLWSACYLSALLIYLLSPYFVSHILRICHSLDYF